MKNLRRLMVALLVVATFEPAGSAEPQWNNIKRRGDDPELLQAQAQAQKKWPLFLKEFAASPKSYYSVKVPLRDGAKVEHAWITVTKANDKEVTGSIDNDLTNVTNYKANQVITVKRTDVEDWIYEKKGASYGGWSVAVQLKRHPELVDKMPKYIQP